MRRLKKVLRRRQKIYGPPASNHANIGLAWTGLLQQHYGITLPHSIPNWLVELMLVELKVNRSARVYHHDNYIDMVAYAGFARLHQHNRRSGKPKKKP